MKSKIKSKLNQNIAMSVSIAVVNTAQDKIKFLNKKTEIQNQIMENQIEKQNIGMSVDIDIEVTKNEIKNKKCSNGK